MALRLIREKGQTVIWNQYSDVVNPSQPWKPTSNAPVSHDPKIAFVPINQQDFATFGYLNGEVPKGAVKGLMGAVNFVPTLKDVVIRDNKTLNIDKFDVININGEIVLYKVIFRD